MENGLYAADIRHGCARRKPRGNGSDRVRHRADRCCEHDEFGIPNRILARSDCVDGSLGERAIECTPAPCRSDDDPRNSTRACRPRHRAAQQPQSNHCDSLVYGHHVPLSRNRFNVLTSRSFSSGSPTLMRI
jgi:hypothetical protein